MLLGLMLLGLERGCREVFPEFLSAAILLASLVAVTRGLHLDGFMDTCDGLFGGYTRQRRLEIMRDSQVGAFGIAGAVSLLLLKYGALVSLLGLAEPGMEWALLLFPMVSRWAMVVPFCWVASAARACWPELQSWPGCWGELWLEGWAG